MKSDPVVAVVGATGLVGKEMVAILRELNFPYSEIRLLASQDSVGDVFEIDDDEIEVELLSETAFEGVDIALFAVSAELAALYVPAAVEAGAFVVDNSSHYRMQKDIPLVVPEVNKHLLNKNTKIIANPNCSTIQLVCVLNPIQKRVALKRVVVSTYQSVSGAGRDALNELWDQSVAIFNQKEIVSKHFFHQIAFNCIPHIDTFTDNGYTREENKIINESRKILGLPDLKITATAVRVPVFHSHAETVNIELEQPLSLQQFVDTIKDAPGLEVFSVHDQYPLQIGAAGGNSVQVGRIRPDESVENGFNLWIVADNLRKGAALNAVQIAQAILELHG